MLTNLEDTSNTSVTGRYRPMSELYALRKARAQAAKEAKSKIKEALSKGIKSCTACGQEKTLLEFDKDKKTYTGYSTWCKSCKKEQKKKYLKEHSNG